jgi:hypothetical protein
VFRSAEIVVPRTLDGHSHAIRTSEVERRRHIVGRFGGHCIRGRAVLERAVPAGGVETAGALLEGEGIVELRHGGAARRTLRIETARGERIIHR